MLAKDHPNWKLLILCYNISLSQNIAQIVQAMSSEPENLFDFHFGEDGLETDVSVPKNITVRNFHQWLKLDLKTSEKQINVLNY